MTNELPQEQAPRSSSSWVRRGLTALGLLIFNLLMMVPAMVYLAMLAAMYVASIAVYVFGIVLTSSSLAGVSEFVIREPAHHVSMHRSTVVEVLMPHEQRRLRIELNQNGLRISPEPDRAGSENDAALVTFADNAERRDLGKGNTLRGIATIFGGIALVLISMIVTFYTWRGLRRYGRFQMRLLQ